MSQSCGGDPGRAVFAGSAADSWTWLSEDGLAWVDVPPIGAPGTGLGPRRGADGPAGVIGSGWSPTNPDTATTEVGLPAGVSRA
jgi:hypothetical protein